MRYFGATCGINERSRATRDSRAHRTRAAAGGGKRAWKAGNARARRGMVQLAWRFLNHQEHSALAQWFRARVAEGKKRKTMIVALARKLLIALWRFLTTGEVPQGVVLRPTSD